jgi:hypothetical protein
MVFCYCCYVVLVFYSVKDVKSEKILNFSDGRSRKRMNSVFDRWKSKLRQKGSIIL